MKKLLAGMPLLPIIFAISGSTVIGAYSLSDAGFTDGIPGVIAATVGSHGFVSFVCHNCSFFLFHISIPFVILAICVFAFFSASDSPVSVIAWSSEIFASMIAGFISGSF